MKIILKKDKLKEYYKNPELLISTLKKDNIKNIYKNIYDIDNILILKYKIYIYNSPS